MRKGGMRGWGVRDWCVGGWGVRGGMRGWYVGGWGVRGWYEGVRWEVVVCGRVVYGGGVYNRTGCDGEVRGMCML